jgi:hypothetical protein
MSEDVSHLPPHLLSSLHSQARLFGFSLSAVFIASLRRSPSVLRPTSKTGCPVPTMVLSEARGLSLFRVIREGLESAVRLGARGTQRLTYQWRLALEPERLKNPTDHRPENFQGRGRTRETLKLFAVSDVGRRTRLLSSKRSKRSRRFCAPASAVPSPAGCPWPPALRRIPGTAPPWWRR